MRGIYKITNKSNGKFYYGSSRDIRKRWEGHKWSLRKGEHQNGYLQNSWNKYGESAFLFEIVEECEEIGDEEMLKREQFFLDTTGCLDHAIGFNIRPRADHKRQSPESIEKCRLARIGQKRTPETIERMRKARMGKYPSLETREKMSRSRIGKKIGPRSEVTKRKLREANLGKKHSNETRKKLSTARAISFLTNPACIKQKKVVEQLDAKTGEIIAEFSSMHEASRATGAERTSISQCCNRRRNYKVSNGFGWRFKIDPPTMRIAQ